jgi:hypothetical protein
LKNWHFKWNNGGKLGLACEKTLKHIPFINRDESNTVSASTVAMLFSTRNAVAAPLVVPQERSLEALAVSMVMVHRQSTGPVCYPMAVPLRDNILPAATRIEFMRLAKSKHFKFFNRTSIKWLQQ